MRPSLLADPHADRLYVTATNRDAVVVIDTAENSIVRWISLARAEGPGAAPVALALAPDGSTLYVADAGENAIVAIALTARSGGAPYSVLGKLPTADYPHDVQVTPDGCTMVWTAARGRGSGPNPGYQFWTFGPPSPYPSYVPQMLTGLVSVLPTPADGYFAQGRTQRRSRATGRARGPPLLRGRRGPDGGPSEQIRYVFFVVKENRSYDQIFGGILHGGEERTDSYPQVLANTDPSYPSDLQVGCSGAPANAPQRPELLLRLGAGRRTAAG